MMGKTRMSPLTALFIGIFGIGAVGIASLTAVVLYGMRIIDTNASGVLRIAEEGVEGLPDLLESLPAIGDALGGHRAPDYVANLDIDVSFIVDERRGGLRPVLTVTNNGNEVVSMLAVRIAALNRSNVPLRDWTEIVATPIAIEDDWRGPMMPGATRYVVVSSCRSIPADKIDDVSGVIEISEIRLWQPTDG